MLLIVLCSILLPAVQYGLISGIHEKILKLNLARFGFESLKFKEQVYFVKATCVKRGSILKKTACNILNIAGRQNLSPSGKTKVKN